MTAKTTKDRCGVGINGSVVHYANGTPAIGANFPDMAGLVKYGHSKGVKMGWYFNVSTRVPTASANSIGI